MRVLPSLDLLVRVLDHHHRGVDHRADGDGDAAQRHDVGVDALPAHHQEGDHHAQRQRDDGHQRRAQVPQEEHAHQRDDDELLEQLERQVVDRALDQRAAVVGGDDLHALRQAGLQLGQARLHRLDRRLRVLARAQHDHAAGHLALAVELGDAAAHLRADLDRGHVAQAHRDAAARGQRDVAEVVQRLQVAAGAHHVFGLGQLQHRAAALLVAGQQRIAHLLVGDAVGDQLVRVEHHLVLPHHAADAGHLGHVGQALQFVLQEPVLQARAVATGRCGPSDRPARTGRSSRRRWHRGRARSWRRPAGGPAPGSGIRARASAPSTGRCRPRTARRRSCRRRTRSRAPSWRRAPTSWWWPAGRSPGSRRSAAPGRASWCG